MASIEQPHRDPRDHDNALGDGRAEGNTDSPSGSGAMPPVQSGADAEEQLKKPSRLREIWGKLELDLPTLMMMFKSVYVYCCTTFFIVIPQTDIRVKGLPASHHSYILVSVHQYCGDIHDPWLSRANPLNSIHGVYTLLKNLCPLFMHAI